ncbi:type III secretion system stator protein SctL [Burkholderia arboris]|uniref:type III secretion system stator protein SctL n=1 Tax=Burkholderia arboris TaxID=488730 RepID=UPI001CF5CE7D|nr:type III secretion system stator protein SctL [Burkholderia arboris]MCA8489311.1 type III secretion system stator protein SctL [Burkholderia arboris]
MVIWLSKPRQADPSAEESYPRFGAQGDILPRETFGTLVDIETAYRQAGADARAELDAAREEARRIVAAGRADADALRDAARAEFASAAQRGFEEGTARGAADWLVNVAQAGSDARAAQERMRARMAEIVAVAVEQIVRSEGASALFERALSAVDRIVEGSTCLHIAVHPDDLDDARAAFDGLASRWRELGRPLPVTVAADRRLARGSCLCESDVGLIDASVSTQLRTMRAAIARALKASVQDAGGPTGDDPVAAYDDRNDDDGNGNGNGDGDGDRNGDRDGNGDGDGAMPDPVGMPATGGADDPAPAASAGAQAEEAGTWR